MNTKSKNKNHKKSEYKKIVAAYQKLIIKILDVENAACDVCYVYDGETQKLYNRLSKLNNGAFVDSAEDRAISEAMKNVKKALNKLK